VLLPVYGVVLVQSLATLEVEIWRTGIDSSILPEGFRFSKFDGEVGTPGQAGSSPVQKLGPESSGCFARRSIG
jgi:hypothetical protein